MSEIETTARLHPPGIAERRGREVLLSRLSATARGADGAESLGASPRCSDDDFKRAWNKLNYYEREAQEWLERGIVTLDEIVDLLMRGVFELCKCK
mmetsp:Transcript_29355/g.53228  ORF Transcript_29355/g.53228 Transcript_29355/m.53228 type:complete len:96 (+) Transcript_29355:84-371(+)